jgi:hypothetical protein
MRHTRQWRRLLSHKLPLPDFGTPFVTEFWQQQLVLSGSIRFYDLITFKKPNM